MQIHELNNYTGNLDSSAYVVVDNGLDTGKLPVTGITDPINERIDNIITGPAPSEAEIIDARLGADGTIYNSLGDAIRTPIGEIDSVLSNIAYLNQWTEENATIGWYVNDYGVITRFDYALTTDYIEVPADTVCTFVFSSNSPDSNFTVRINGYDENETWVRLMGKQIVSSEVTDTFTMTFNPSDDVSLIRISLGYNAYVNTRVLVYNDLGIVSANDRVLRNDIENKMQFTPSQMSFFSVQSKNLINPANINGNIRPRVSTVNLIPRAGNFSGSGFIEVEEGKTYTASGTAFTVFQGVYFGPNAIYQDGQAGIATATFFEAVDGSGMCFTVPEGLNIKYIAVNLADTGVLVDGEYPIAGTYQIELGEVATNIVPYDGAEYIDEKYIKNPGDQPVVIDVDAMELLPRPSYDTSKISSFKDHWFKKDKDLMVCSTGTSLTARAVEHTTLKADASTRPPLMDCNNLASYIWDAMAWEGQQYRRYDVAGFFTEIGTFQTVSTMPNWDEGSYRAGLTRYCDGAASVEFEIPEEAYQFNFIYRTDSLGSETVTVTIGEGNNKVEVYNGSDWVEANGFEFSMRQSAVILPSVTVPIPNSNGQTATIANYQVGGNTTYQKRLKMRCKSGNINSTGSIKTVTISSSTDRFMYWGVEWAPREFMITYINAARGSHNITYNSQYALMHYQDNEIWSFKPDLMFTENPIHNSGAGEAPSSTYHTYYWGNITNDFFFNESDPISLVSRAAANGIDTSALEWVIFNTSVAWNFGTIDNNGNLKIALNADGFAMSSLDEQMYSNLELVSKDKALVINAIKYWINSAYEMYGNLKAATIGSGKAGDTLTDEGSHWNDRGCALMARCICPVLDFYNN